METAINIGYACSLLTNEQHRLMIFSETPELLDAERRDDPDLSAITEREVMQLCFWLLIHSRATRLLHPHICLMV